MKGIGKKSTKQFSLLCVCLLLAMLQHTYANEACSRISLQSFQVLEDTAGKQDIKQVMNIQEQFAPRENLAFGYTQSAFWVKCDVPVLCSNTRYYIVSNYGSLDYIDFYVVRGDSILKGLQTGYLRPLATREKMYTKMVMEVPQGVQAGDDIYIRLKKKEGTLRTQLSIQDETTLSENNFSAKLQLFFFLGVSFLIMLFALAYLIYFKGALFAWYIMFVVSFVCHQAVNQGFGPIYVWGDWFWMSNISRVAFNAPAVLATLLFSYQILRVKDFSPRWVNVAYKCLIVYKLFEIPLPFLPLPEYPWRFILYAIHCVGVAAVLVFCWSSMAALQRSVRQQATTSLSPP